MTNRKCMQGAKSAYAYQRYLFKTLNDNGLDGEEQAAQLLTAAGFVVYFDRTHDIHATDLIVYPHLEIEVKASTVRPLNKRPNYVGFQFNLYRTGRSKRIKEPLTVLVCQTSEANVPFIVPSHLIAHHSALAIVGRDPYLYSKKWSFFRERFDYLESHGAVRFEKGFVTDDQERFNNAGAARIAKAAGEHLRQVLQGGQV